MQVRQNVMQLLFLFLFVNSPILFTCDGLFIYWKFQIDITCAVALFFFIGGSKLLFVVLIIENRIETDRMKAKVVKHEKKLKKNVSEIRKRKTNTGRSTMSIWNVFVCVRVQDTISQATKGAEREFAVLDLLLAFVYCF